MTAFEELRRLDIPAVLAGDTDLGKVSFTLPEVTDRYSNRVARTLMMGFSELQIFIEYFGNFHEGTDFEACEEQSNESGSNRSPV